MRGADAPRRGVPRITIVAGPGQGRALALVKTMATVGRHATNDLVVADASVSGVHLELRREGARVRARDAGSTNGTWLGPSRIFDIELGMGAELRVGESTLRLDMAPDMTESDPVAPLAFGGLVGRSAPMRELFTILARVASKPLGVLVQGETGTGKEEVARAIHAHSERADKPFVVIDATSLPEALVESLLFGHEPGAFPGADGRRVGLFEAASGGTVFIDEIGELPAPSQAKFLRVLERKELQRLGGTSPVRVDVRIIAATHRDLRHEVDAKRFREDLFYRLAQVHVHVAPLRARPEDIELLCAQALEQAFGSRAPVLDDGALAYLREQPWPGNVRELRNVVQRASALCGGAVIRRADVAGEGGGFRGTRGERELLDLTGSFATAKDIALERFESAYLSALMKRCGGNLSLAAREAGLARHHLRDRLKKRSLYGVAWDDGADGD